MSSVKQFELLVALDESAPKRIAVVGDAITDVYVHGWRSTCQDDCFKFVEQSRTTCDGGAANAASCLEHWRSNAQHFGDTGSPSIKTRFIEHGQVIFRHDQESLIVLPASRTRELRALWKWEPHAILVSDYDKGFLRTEDIAVIILEANKRCIPIVADAKRPPAVYQGAVLKCNSHYAEMYAQSIAGRPQLVITDGAACPRLHLPIRCSDSPVTCVNHVGAGDCFAAHLTLALVHGFSLEDAAKIAHSAGRVYVQHAHNRAPYPSEVRKDYGSRSDSEQSSNSDESELRARS